MMDLRTGQGFDAHPFAKGHHLVLGGVKIPHEEGLAGHSDADVLTHAIIDALLGAAALGDIGTHFPPTDPAYKDISSLDLLDEVSHILAKNGWRVINIDATIIAQVPRLSPHTPEMITNIQSRLPGKPTVNVKATTTEDMGFTGRREGVAAMAAALITRAKEE